MALLATLAGPWANSCSYEYLVTADDVTATELARLTEWSTRLAPATARVH